MTVMGVAKHSEYHDLPIQEHYYNIMVKNNEVHIEPALNKALASVGESSTEYPPCEYTGTYMHYKGNPYTLLGVGTRTDTSQKMVVYMNADYELWVRPFDMFFENVLFKGNTMPRFAKV